MAAGAYPGARDAPRAVPHARRYAPVVGPVRRWAHTLLTLGGSPHGIAGGFALGLALSLVPVPFAGMFLALALAPILRLNLPATYLGTAVVNPVTGPAFYFAELWLGTWLMGDTLPRWAELRALDGSGWLALALQTLPRFALGAATSAALLAPAAYGLVRLAVRATRSRRGPRSPHAGADDGCGPAQAPRHVRPK